MVRLASHVSFYDWADSPFHCNELGDFDPFVLEFRGIEGLGFKVTNFGSKTWPLTLFLRNYGAFEAGLGGFPGQLMGGLSKTLHPRTRNKSLPKPPRDLRIRSPRRLWGVM